MARWTKHALHRYPPILLTAVFFALSFAGWLWEGLLNLYLNGAFVNRGILRGPWLPIYGAGAVLICLCMHRLARRPLVLFFVSALSCTAVEYMTSWALEAATGLRWWDYTGYAFNLGGRVCLSGFLLFGFGSLLIVYLAAPLIEKALRRVSRPTKRALAGLLIAALAADALFACLIPHTGPGVTDYRSPAWFSLPFLK